MNTILESLWQIYSETEKDTEQINTEKKIYHEKYRTLQKALVSSLSETQKALFLEYEEAKNTYISLTEKDAFIHGICYGNCLIGESSNEK